MPLLVGVVVSLLRFEEQRQMRNGVCPMTKRGRSQSFVPIVIQNELASGPADVDELSRRIPRCRRLLIYYLNKMVKDGILEKVVNLKNLHKPVYRLKVK